MKLDTATGAIHALQGSVGARKPGGDWLQRVPPVGTGMFEVQRTGGASMDAVFLVDTVSGATWHLRWRGNQNGSWEPLKER